MGTALLLGIPAGYVGTAKSALSKDATISGTWAIKFVPASRREAEISQKMVGQAQSIASQYSDTHIFGFSTQSNRKDFAEQLSPYFRFRWFDHSLLKCLGSPDPTPFVKTLASDLAEESEWAARVKPADHRSPLLLPESSFVPAPKHRDLWRHASAYGDPLNIIGAEKVINGFRNAHHRKVVSRGFRAYKWVDENDRVYDTEGERHGAAPFPRGWKFSFRIESGFHFDVTHADGRPFVLTDAIGNQNRVNAGAYLNVDPHGYVIS
jgi:hypothetical protein